LSRIAGGREKAYQNHIARRGDLVAMWYGDDEMAATSASGGGGGGVTCLLPLNACRRYLGMSAASARGGLGGSSKAARWRSRWRHRAGIFGGGGMQPGEEGISGGGSAVALAA